MSDSIIRREELASAVTHGIGAAASLAGGAVLITLAAVFGNGWQVVSAVVFSVALVVLYSASTLLHTFCYHPVRPRLRLLDHSAIFILIAGTYTPFTLVSLRGPWGWSLFAVVWTLAVLGIVFKVFFIGRFDRISTAIYLGMGWLAIIAARPMIEALSAGTLVWLVLGGLAYTLGTFFYHSRRVPFAHAIWHLFVLGGSACHFAAVLTQVVPI